MSTYKLIISVHVLHNVYVGCLYCIHCICKCVCVNTIQVRRLTQQMEEHSSNASELDGRVATLQAEVAGLAGDKLELEVST